VSASQFVADHPQRSLGLVAKVGHVSPTLLVFMRVSHASNRPAWWRHSFHISCSKVSCHSKGKGWMLQLITGYKVGNEESERIES
jgi:hypothetical protein